MCEVFQEYQLSLCSDPIDKTRPYWVLSTGVSNKKEVNNTITTEALNVYSDEEVLREIAEDRWLENLNSTAIFGFTYDPKAHDVLTLFEGKFTHQFIYSLDRDHLGWRVFGKHPFEHDQHLFKLRERHKGIVENSI